MLADPSPAETAARGAAPAGAILFDRDALAADLARVAAGDRGALAAVYRVTSAKLYGVCLRVLRDDAEAEEALQEAYLAVWRGAGSFRPGRASPVTWLAAIARNRAVDRLRARAARPGAAPLEDAAEASDPGPTPAEVVEADERAARLAGCLGELEPGHADAIRAAFLDGLTYEALAARDGAPLGTVKSRIRRGLLRLRGCLER